MTKTIKDYFKEFEDEVVRLEGIIEANNGLTDGMLIYQITRHSAVKILVSSKGLSRLNLWKINGIYGSQR
jgi:hypothetical protein